MIFKENVWLHKPAFAGSKPITMHTEKLTYLPKDEHAYTHHPVKFTQVGQTILANGMKADLKLNRITLNKAHAEIEPDQS